MQILELLELTFWIDRNIKSPAITQKYQQLQAVIQQNVNARNNQAKQPFEVQKNAVIDEIIDISTSSLTNEQERMLSSFGILDHLGQTGVDKLEGILFKNSLDIATAAVKVNEIVQKFNIAIQRSDQIQTNLKPLIPDYESQEEPENNENVVMRVHFQNEVSLENISDFKKLGNTWWEIGRGIAMAHDHSPEDIKVIGAQKGSIIIELAVIAAIATTTSTIILSALKVADRVLTIRKKAEEIKALKLSNQKLENDLEKEAEKEKKEGLENITKEISINLNINQNGDGEKVKVLEKSIRNLIDFVEKGGEVDFFTPDQDEESEEIEKLRVNFSEIKKLEKRVLSLEDKNS
ncbi:hypothetical protein HF888_12265 [Bermanella marisrubri]|uniref:Uncharacterized protein n=1 Tax=Bermanella marisrubri TaxID=207949 RepID=Q1MZW9_9GAMM|nr:hypothetical protein [Bermanella marisrubri]EAT11594.1 hypothetical protein RED65_02949 [Oceanobacter sp. RED65] [Bermanella marisrubri]EAT12492.1 hypothetical protein RED65_06343 [Oceanobacter sp. RED65] [Bermanella marisrubri]QIZ84945.1 hypothetical protein HF888_12265 [Bermanella marisrubri]